MQKTSKTFLINEKLFVVGVSALYAVLYLLIGPPTASPLLGTGAPWVSLPRPTTVPSDTQASGIGDRAPTLWLLLTVLQAVLMLRLTDVKSHPFGRSHVSCGLRPTWVARAIRTFSLVMTS